MSIINRMLVDLERRGAPSRRESGGDLSASPPPRRQRRRPQPRKLLIAMAVVLTFVAAALWAQRGGRILDAWPFPAGASAEPARLLRVSFEQDDARSSLRLRVEGELARAPSYQRNGGSATLVVDAVSGDLPLPAPPPGQRVFRSVALEPLADSRTRIRLEVEPAAELDLSVRGRRIALVGRMPVAAEPAPAVPTEGESPVVAVPAPAGETSAVAADAGTTPASAAGDAAGKAAAAGAGATAADSATAARDTAEPAPAVPDEAELPVVAVPVPASGTPAVTADAGTTPASAAGDAAGEAAAAEAGATAADGGRPARVAAEAEAGAAAADEAAKTASADTAAPPSDAVTAGVAEAGSGATARGPQSPAKRAVAGDSAGGAVRKTQSVAPEVRSRRRYREARTALDGGELAAARTALQDALQLDPALHEARDLLVALLRRAGDTVAARRLLAEGVELAPARSRFAMPYARLLVDTGELGRAVAVLEAARVEGTGAADFHALLAAIEQRRGQHRAAIAEYTRALEVRPGNGLWWLGLGISLAAIEHPREAQSAFREARASGTLEPALDQWAQDRIKRLNARTEG